jgi:SAM-dependent methyltransferase
MAEARGNGRMVMGAVEFWEERYGSRPQVWSGRVNPVLTDVAAGLPPLTALDLGCGEGGDAVWLARQGWQVTAVDISRIAVERGRAAAREAGIGERITWLVQDLGEWVPSGAYDLVSAFFLQSPVHLPRADVLRRAATAVAPGGRLLVVSHAAPPPWATPLHAGHNDFPTPEGDIADLRLAEGEWEVVTAEVRTRAATGPDGEPATLDDSVVLLRRLPAEPGGSEE